MPDDKMTMNDFLQVVMQVFPEADPNYIRRLVNEKTSEIALKYNLIRREHAFDIVSGQMNYDLKGLGATKVWRVSVQDDDSIYTQIPQLLDGDQIKKWDRN